ncbi:hypothetical protein [Micromonospora violae]|uniref:hypothetical protein n=1 Tax=Micromonospora violae TaxID=1278207 RepID=UPI0033D62FB0
MIRLTLGEREMANGLVRPEMPELLEAILLDIARYDYRTPAEVDALVVAAERRAAQVTFFNGLQGARWALAAEAQSGWRAMFDDWRRGSP